MNEASSPRSTGYDPAEIIKTHQSGVWRYLRALGCEASQAEDITQETFLSVLQNPFVEYSPAATAAYLRKVAYNLFITIQRRAGRVTAVENVEDFDTAWNEWAGDDGGEDLVDALRGCLEQLSSRARTALELRFRDKVSRVEIGEALGITEHGAKNLMQRAKTQLRDCIENKIVK